MISPNGMRSLFIADRLPTLREVNIAFAHVWQGLGHEQGYLLAELIDPVFLVKSTGARLLDRLFDAIEPWLVMVVQIQWWHWNTFCLRRRPAA
jgi:hypothetical protein